MPRKAVDMTAGTKMFEFTRLRCMKRAARESMLPPSFAADKSILQFGVPKKRSGHRAVCNEENLWIWGGYCPVEEMSDDEDLEDASMDSTNDQDNRSPLFPEVHLFYFIFTLFEKVFFFYFHLIHDVKHIAMAI